MRIASPSLRNWALFEHAFPKDVLTDFAFIEHSFGLTAGGSGPLMLGLDPARAAAGPDHHPLPAHPRPPADGFHGRVGC